MRRLISSLVVMMCGGATAAMAQNENSVIIRQLDGGHVSIKQSGENNSVLIDQGMGESQQDYNRAIMNDAKISQFGRANNAIVNQTGKGINNSSVTQEGESNSASQTQTGEKNTMKFKQKGKRNKTSHKQNGKDNMLIKEQNNDVLIERSSSDNRK